MEIARSFRAIVVSPTVGIKPLDFGIPSQSLAFDDKVEIEMKD